MDAVTRQAYDAARIARPKRHEAACYAPWAAMYFDPHGLVQACCLNLMHPLGNVATQSLTDIWNGPQAQALRQAMRDYDLTQGCRHCLWHVEGGSPESTYALRYDQYHDAFDDHAWPRMMEFQISNVCNLECVQCRGEWSSLVRRNRERLPPLPKVYGEGFFAELRPFLRRLQVANFLGGEPFLAPETLRIWEMMIEDGLQTSCCATTNGTVYDRRVERILEALPVTIIISLDGCTRETYEAIRRNADFDAVLSNLARFREYARDRGVEFYLTHCLMQQNWREFGDFLLFGDRWDCDVWVNLVLDPPSSSLYRMPEEELRQVVQSLEAQSAAMERQLTRNLPVWRRELTRLQSAFSQHDNSNRSYITSDLLGPLATQLQPAREAMENQQAQGLQALRQLVGSVQVEGLLCDANDVVQGLTPGTQQFLGCALADLQGRRIADVFSLLRTKFSAELKVTAHREQHGGIWREIELGNGTNGIEIHLITWPRWTVAGGRDGSVTYATSRSLNGTVVS